MLGEISEGRTMLKKLLFLAVIAGLVYLNMTNPGRADHREKLLAELEKSGPVSARTKENIFRDLDFSNFLVCSTMKTIEDSKMITVGYRRNVELVNSEWLASVRKQ